MRLEDDKDVLNNVRLTKALTLGMLPEVLNIFRIPLINCDTDLENDSIKAFFISNITSALTNVTNVGNGIKAMLRLKEKNHIEMNEDEIKEHYALSCRGITENTFLNIDSFVSKDLYYEMDVKPPAITILNAYGDRYMRFCELIATSANEIEKFGIAK